jgi:XTP/dITP diphosphohydrolase
VIRLLVATSNPHKLAEFRRILEPLGLSIVSPVEAGVELEVEETGNTFAENAVLKARAYSEASAMAAVADDSGIVVDALGGEPGVYSARFGGPGLTDAERTALLVERMKDVPEERRSARFLAAVALAVPGREPLVFKGEVEGKVTTGPRGSHGFGYDPVFYYPPFGMTFAEVDSERKDAVSHRARALQALVRCLTEQDLPSILG